jgi:class 3 adenylate cyclase/tetratricopeptide (TPR) repeat protein/type II secretory pathway predicted ATPase ExeA
MNEPFPSLTCPHCSRVNLEDAKFCQNCGQPLARTCKECGTANEAEAKFCRTCGKSLELTPQSSTEARLTELRQLAPERLQEKMRASSTQVEGERKPVTILFTDIVGSTSIAEKLDPEEWKEIVLGAHRRVGEAIYRYEGTIAQLLGDGVLAFFGAPITHEDDPVRAVRAALDIQESIKDYALELEDLVESFQMRIGINTGEVVIGDIGTDMHMEYLAIGDAVNVAARLQSAAKPGKGLLSGSSARLIGDAFKLKSLGDIAVKGKEESVETFELVGVKAPVEIGRKIHEYQTPHVGRESEVEALRSALLKLCEGHGQIVSLIGEAGIGKTRLLEEVREILRDRNYELDVYSTSPSSIRWLEGRALSYGSSLPYWTITHLLLTDLGLSDGASQVKIKVALRQRMNALFSKEETTEVMPFIANILGIALEGKEKARIEALDHTILKNMTHNALREYFTHLAKECPTVLVIEDMHWLDPSSLEVLEGFLALTDHVPLMILMLMRIDRDHGSWQLRTKAETDFHHRYTDIHLRRLSEKDSDMLVIHLLGGGELPEEIWETIMARTEGNPFYVEEMVRHMIEEGMIAKYEEQWSATEAMKKIGIPDTLQGVLLARIDRLEEDVRHTLQMASVIGKSFLYRILETISEAERELDVHLSQLQRLDLVREKARIPELEYIFKHSLTQEAAYNSLLVERRRVFHLKVAETIETLFLDRKEEFLGLLAHHYLLAESHNKAASYLFKAGEKAFFRDGAFQTALIFIQQASDLYGTLDDVINLGAAQSLLGMIHWGMGDRVASIEHQHRALSILENEPESPELAWVVTEISRMHMLASEWDEAIRWGERGLALAEMTQHDELRLHALITIGTARANSGDIERGFNELREGLSLSIESGFLSPITRSYFNLTEHYINQGQYTEARTLSQEYRQYGLEAEHFFSQASSLMRLTELDWICGLWDQAIKNLELLYKSQDIYGIWNKVVSVSIRNDLGQYEEARNDLEVDLELAISTDEIQTILPYLGQLARSYAALGLDKKVDEVVKQILERVDSIPYFDKVSTMALVFAIDWFASRRDPKSLEDSNACVAHLERGYHLLKSPPIEAALAEGKGIHALAGGQVSEAIGQLNQATAVWKQLGRPYDQARAIRELGRALATAKDIEAAKDCYAQAIELIDTLAALLTDDEMRNSFLASELVTDIRQERAALEEE